MADENTGPWLDTTETARAAALVDEVRSWANEEFIAVDGHLVRRAHITRIHVTLEGTTFYLLDGSTIAFRASHEELKRLLGLG